VKLTTYLTKFRGLKCMEPYFYVPCSVAECIQKPWLCFPAGN